MSLNFKISLSSHRINHHKLSPKFHSTRRHDKWLNKCSAKFWPINFPPQCFSRSKCAAKKKEKKEKAQIIVGEKFPLPHTPDVFPAECVCGGVIFMRLTRGNTHTHSRRRKNWGLVRKNALELTHAPRFLVQRYLISCWLVLGWLDHSSIFGWLGWYYTFWSTGRGTDMISLIFFYCLEKHTRIFIKVAKVCKFAVPSTHLKVFKQA